MKGGKEMSNIIKNRRVRTDEFDAWLKQSGLKSGFVADVLGITRQALYSKRKGLVAFSLEDLQALKSIGMTSEWVSRIFGL